MKIKSIVFLMSFFVTLHPSFAVNTVELESAIINWLPNSRNKTYIPVLCEYGFTEAQINLWRFTNLYVDMYFNEIHKVLRNNKYEQIAEPTHFIGTIRAIGEIQNKDFDNLIIFLNDIYVIAQEMNAERLAILDKKIIKRENGIVIYGYNITYDGNGNTAGELPVDGTLYHSGTLVELKDGRNLKKDGFMFMGWSEDKEANSWLTNPKINLTHDTTFYAIWSGGNTLNDSPSRISQQKQNVGHSVFIGNSGSKYHRKDCRTLRKGSSEININTAKSKGYTSCKICNP
jgi:uncharacterized repeat protein (TIGR02543 family)